MTKTGKSRAHLVCHFVWSSLEHMLRKNPIISLILTGWDYAGSRRYQVIVYLILYALSESTMLAEPYIIGRLLNCVQTSATAGFKNPNQLLHQMYFYIGLLFVTHIIFWVFHGPGRVIERNLAFRIKADYPHSHVSHSH